MRFPIFASFIVFGLWLMYEISKSKKTNLKAMQDFWEKESEANGVRKKPLDHLDYIAIPYDTLPFDLLRDDPIVTEAIQTIQDLKEKRIVNLTGITNTELKLTYGTANITVLTEYDQNYTLYASAICKWGEALYNADFQKEAVALLELGIASRTDISTNYRILYHYYTQTGDDAKIKWLRDTAETLNSAMKNTIIRLLWGGGQTAESTDPYNG